MKTCIRAITLPVAKPIGLEWKEAGPLLDTSLEQSRLLHNWLVRMYVRLDSAPPVIKKGKQCLPPMPKDPTKKEDGYSLYLGARQVAPLLNSGTVSQIAQDVRKAYKRERFDVWRGARALRCYRSAILPVRKQEMVKKKASEQPELRLTEIGGRLEIGFPFSDPKTGNVVWTRWALKGGRRYGRSASGARAIARGQAELRTVYFLKKRGKLMCKIVARFPVRQRDPGSRGDLLVSTHPDALLRYVSGGNRLPARGKQDVGWLRYDHVRRLLAQRRRYADRMRDDMVHERRNKPKRARMTAGNKVRLDKLSRALADAVKCAAKEVVAVAVRRRCARLVYRDQRHVETEKNGKTKTGLALDDRYVSGLRWHDLKARIATLCNENDIEFVYDEEASLVPEDLELGETVVEDLVKEHIELTGSSPKKKKRKKRA